MTHAITARHERLPLSEPFVISRGAKTAADVIVVTIDDGQGHVGHGEAVPYARYGETIEGALALIANYDGPLDRIALLRSMPAGAARNALDCALWDLEAKISGVAATARAGVDHPQPLVTCYTLSLAAPEAMADRARRAAHLPLLKLKLGGEGDHERMLAVRAARPDARLVADANEAWTADTLPALMATAEKAGIELIEQPLPAGDDAALAHVHRPVPVCADESVHTAADVPGLAPRYDAVNIKLDKAGGLTEALALSSAARNAGLEIMVGSMVASSLAAAPALILAAAARWVDLDGPLLLAQDRQHGLDIRNGIIMPPDPRLWG
ncbi:MAG: N-acetyl-D-Glu racemase DgcA [Hyphomicrobiaceae bacterium]